METISGIILTGGKSHRMGTLKQNLQINSKTFLDIAISNLQPFVTQIYLSGLSDVANSPYPVIPDKIKDIGPLGGLFSALSVMETNLAIVIPVDMPFLNTAVIKKLLHTALRKSAQATVARFQDRQQPLCAVYSKTVLPTLEKQIAQKDYKIKNLLKKLSVSEVKFSHSDDFITKNTFLNINTPEDLKLAGK